jgi:hypothetical protein
MRGKAEMLHFISFTFSSRWAEKKKLLAEKKKLSGEHKKLCVFSYLDAGNFYLLQFPGQKM